MTGLTGGHGYWRFELLGGFFRHTVHSTEYLPDRQAWFQPVLTQATPNLQAPYAQVAVVSVLLTHHDVARAVALFGGSARQ